MASESPDDRQRILLVTGFALSGLYSTNPNRKLARDFTRLVLACSTGFAAITMYIFFTRH